MDEKRIDLGDDDEIRKTIERAANGSQADAWLLISQLEHMLRDRKISPELFDHAARFFGELLDLRERGSEKPRELIRALDALYIVRPRGQPNRAPEETSCLAARVVLMKRANFTVEAALDLLSSTIIGSDEKSHALGAYKLAYYEDTHDGLVLGEQMDSICKESELEALAQIESKTLVDSLVGGAALVQISPMRNKQKK